VLSFKLGQTATETHDMFLQLLQERSCIPTRAFEWFERIREELQDLESDPNYWRLSTARNPATFAKTWWPRDRRLTLKLVEDHLHINGRRFLRLFLKTWEWR
jgi:hypothetical protein